jgi:excisionase family DNA binding protein
VTASLAAATPSSLGPDEHPVHSGPDTAHRARRTKGMRRGNPTQPQGRTQVSPYLHTAEVADILHVSPKTVSRWAKEGKLSFLKTLGGHRRYPEAEIRQLANELQVPPTA